MSAAIVTRDLAGGYGAGRTGVEDVSFEAATGERVAVLGPNGGGKTTLFRALLGELPEIRGVSEVAGRLGYVPQTERSRLDFPVHALDVALMGSYSRTPWYRRVSSADRDLAEAALARVGLGELARAPYGSLSGGQRQRVMIARALTQDAGVFLLDEPLSGVDATSAAHIGQVFDELAAEGRTLLIATHDVDQARAADKVLCLNRTQVAFGAPGETLSVDVLQRTYGSELVVLEPGVTAVAVDHHEH